MAERALGPDDAGELAPPGVDQQHRHNGERARKNTTWPSGTACSPR